MAKLFVLPAMHRKRGNPNWGKPLPHIPFAATEFEVEVRKLGLTKQTYAGSTRLRIWCEVQQESVLHTGMAASDLGNSGGFKLLQLSLTETTVAVQIAIRTGVDKSYLLGNCLVCQNSPGRNYRKFVGDDELGTCHSGRRS